MWLCHEAGTGRALDWPCMPSAEWQMLSSCCRMSRRRRAAYSCSARRGYVLASVSTVCLSSRRFSRRLLAYLRRYMGFKQSCTSIERLLLHRELPYCSPKPGAPLVV
jgi:hypothetical protein